MQNIIIKNINNFNKKLMKIKNQGKNNLHVLSDFDKTLTKCFLGNKKAVSGFGLIRAGNYLSPDYVKKSYAMYDEYHPIELNDTIPLKLKKQKMKEWWKKHEQLLIDAKLHKSVIQDIIEKNPNILREGYDVFFTTLKENKIPLLIFSSGFGNLIQEYLKKSNYLSENVFLLSNIFEFDQEGFAKGYKTEPIHVFNKSDTRIMNKNYLNTIKERKNIILLGDSIGDLGMSKNLNYETILKIGFLNENINENLETYKQKFDVVILEDGSMNFINKILENLF